MGNLFSKFTQTLKGHKNVLFIIAAALLVELFSAAQYYFAHNLGYPQRDGENCR